VIRIGGPHLHAQPELLGIGPKAALLDRCAQAGLRVPPGVVVPHEDLHDAAGAPIPAVADALVGQRLGRRLAVRSAFSAEDGARSSHAGAFRSRLEVPGDDPVALAAALTDVLASADDVDVEVARRDVLVLRMIPAVRAGVAFTQPDFEDDLVDHVGGLADRLVGGEVAGERESLPRLRRFERGRPGWRGRLQSLLRGVRRVLGDGSGGGWDSEGGGWDIEWADDGVRCWLVQVRVITAAPSRDEALTLANHREILPDLPSRFTTSVVADAAPELFGYWRSFDDGLPSGRHFVDVVAGRPVINLSLLTDTMRILGLPTRFVTDSMGGTAAEEVGFAPLRLVAKAPNLMALGLDQLRAVGNGRRASRRLQALAADPGDDLTTAVATFRQVYIELITGMFALTTAISGPLAVLHAVGVAGVLHTRQRTAGTKVWADLHDVRAALDETPGRRERLAAGDLPTDPPERSEFAAAWSRYLDVHGHRGIYESDIARPRYREDPAPLVDALLHGRELADPPPLPTRAIAVWPLWVQASRSIVAREELRSDAMKVFEVMRLHLLALAAAHVAAGRLPDVDVLWDLTLHEVAALDGSEGRPGAVYDDAWVARRRAEIAELRTYRLPDLLHRSDDVESYRRDAHTGPRPTGGRLRGLGLTDGEVVGTVWLVDEPTPMPPELRGEDVVLVTRGVDAGWVGTFAQVAAVVVETGGELSHGSIVLRETGVPAVTNVAGATDVLASGDRVRVRARAGVVERLT
jgi:rifampicin phosphotransferase